MSRAAALLFAIVCYAIFFATFLYLIVFVGDFTFAYLTVDSGPAACPPVAAVIDLLLISLFGLQHSVMARQGFKRWWLNIIAPPIERSIYVLSASIMLMILFLCWRPIDSIVWNVSNPTLVSLIWLLFWAGWATVLISTFLINHFELFGLQQAWFFLAFWAAPEMTAGHLLLAAGLSIYMLIAIRYEETDLVHLFGKDYELYR